EGDTLLPLFYEGSAVRSRDLTQDRDSAQEVFAHAGAEPANREGSGAVWPEPSRFHAAPGDAAPEPHTDRLRAAIPGLGRRLLADLPGARTATTGGVP